MSISGISFSGLASGLDTRAIIDALVAAERIPINQLENRKAGEQQKVSLVGTFKGLVEGLKDAAKGLGSIDEFMSFNVSTAYEGVASITATGEAQAASHTIEVTQLAAADRIAFDGVADPDQNLAFTPGEGVSFDYKGTNYDIQVPVNGSSLNEIAQAINDATGGEVSASVVNSGTSASPSYQLVLAGSETGSDAQIQNLSSTVLGLGGTTQLTSAQDAVAIIDGLQVTRSSNEFNDVIQGVQIDLESTNPSDPMSFTVTADTGSVKEGIQGFIDAYNEVINFINEQNTYSEDDGAGGALFGDTLLRSVKQTIDGVLFSQTAAQVGADLTGFGTLSLIGIKQDNSGSLSLDATIFDGKVDENLAALADLFVDSDGFDNGGLQLGDPNYFVDQTADSGIADQLARALEATMSSFTDPVTNVRIEGIFDSRTSALTATIDGFDKTIESRERYLEQFEANLVQRYTALESLMGQLNARQSSLLSSLGSLPGLNNGQN